MGQCHCCKFKKAPHDVNDDDTFECQSEESKVQPAACKDVAVTADCKPTLLSSGQQRLFEGSQEITKVVLPINRSNAESGLQASNGQAPSTTADEETNTKVKAVSGALAECKIKAEENVEVQAEVEVVVVVVAKVKPTIQAVTHPTAISEIEAEAKALRSTATEISWEEHEEARIEAAMVQAAKLAAAKAEAEAEENARQAALREEETRKVIAARWAGYQGHAPLSGSGVRENPCVGYLSDLRAMYPDASEALLERASRAENLDEAINMVVAYI